ncbi:MAG: hypothetical protein FD134_828 [Gallionellaceae bacterium]|nr:MAG: hypothetical protein FD134_828 [Gallionellaceae bacterium]
MPLTLGRNTDRSLFFLLSCLIAAAFACPSPSFAREAAKVLSVEGVSTLQRAGAATRILGVADTLDEQDVISVGPKSYAVIEFADRTQATLRPDTVFRMDALSPGKPESLLRGLVKGGARITSNPGTARAAEFDARLCEEDCAQEDRSRPAPRGLDQPVARVVEMKGYAAASSVGGNARLLVPGAAIHEREGIATGANSYAVLLFSDGARVTLAERSRLAVNRYEYREISPREGKAHLTLLAGNAQVWSGRLAEVSTDAFLFESAMGIIRSPSPERREVSHE